MKAVIALVVFAAATFGVLWFTGFPWRSSEAPGPGGETACTMEAKLCPDGSYVGRTGPTCEFASCPAATTTPPQASAGGIAGFVTTSPTCPVERMPPDPQCAPRPYAGRIEVRRTGESALVASGTSDQSRGYFALSLPPGTYEVRATGGTPYPHCEATQAIVTAGATTSVALSCDTGIR